MSAPCCDPYVDGYTPNNLLVIAEYLGDGKASRGKERIAAMLQVTGTTVRRWCMEPEKRSHCPMPFSHWRKLQETVSAL